MKSTVISHLPPCGECEGCREVAAMQDAIAEADAMMFGPRLKSLGDAVASGRVKFELLKRERDQIIEWRCRWVTQVAKTFKYPFCNRLGVYIEEERPG